VGGLPHACVVVVGALGRARLPGAASTTARMLSALGPAAVMRGWAGAASRAWPAFQHGIVIALHAGWALQQDARAGQHYCMLHGTTIAPVAQYGTGVDGPHIGSRCIIVGCQCAIGSQCTMSSTALRRHSALSSSRQLGISVHRNDVAPCAPMAVGCCLPEALDGGVHCW
jgi:hypothetical protein